LFPDNYTEAGIRSATEASLRRLGVETLDLTQLHCIPPAVLRRGEVFGWLAALRDEGKILRFGASVESDEEGMICLEHEGLASLQIIFNVFRQKPSFALLEEARRKGVAIIVRLPLASGVLSGKFTASTSFPAQDHRNYNRDGGAFNVGETFAGIPFEKAVELAGELRLLLPQGADMAGTVQRWILDHPAVTTVITGASRPEQAVSNAAVSSMPPLSPELHEKLTLFYRNSVASHIRGPY
jgi:aryl-alcohol dehydrogenase-like predicted oxidoreductase